MRHDGSGSNVATGKALEHDGPGGSGGGNRWYQSQPDYCMAREGDQYFFRNVAFCQPQVHNSDHHAVVALILRGQARRLKAYRHDRRTLPLTLPSLEEQDDLTRAFGELRKTCKKEGKPTRARLDWISAETWTLIEHRAMLHHSGHLCQTGGRRLTRWICSSLASDRAA